MIVLSQPPIRRRFFEVFYRLHIVLSIVAMIAGIIHLSPVIIGGAVPWLADIVYRYVFIAGMLKLQTSSRPFSEAYCALSLLPNIACMHRCTA